MNLDSYFARIGWSGTRAADYATLAAILDLHTMRIPFENLDVLLGRPPKLDVPSLVAKLVDARRGGYCYEHATLFAAVLEELGFAVARHSARVTMARPKSDAPRTHMFLTVKLPEGTFVVDPGFGGLTPRVPLNVDGTPNGDYWLARDGADITLMARTPEKIVAAWVSTLEVDYPIDFEMANHFTATSPLSPFTTRLTMRAFTPSGRITVMNRVVTQHPSQETMQLADGAALRAVVRDHFGFDLPELDTLALPAAP
jgi:N-hydroxyarylamine O-acetyltransferase